MKNVEHVDIAQNRGWRRLLNRRNALIAAVVALIVVGVVFVMVRQSEQTPSTAPVDEALQTANRAFDTGDYERAERELNEALSNVQDDTEKAALYDNLSAVAASGGDAQAALDYLAKKHHLDPASAEVNAYIMASYYERLGDRAKALSQYKVALQYLQSLPNASALDIHSRISSVQARIAALEDGNE